MSEAAGHDFNHLPPGAAGLGHVFARPKLVAVLCVVVLAVLGWVYLALLLAGMGGSFGGLAWCRRFVGHCLTGHGLPAASPLSRRCVAQ